jgi:hypothetical protein
VTSWSKASIQMKYRTVYGSAIRLAGSQETTGP